MPGVVVAFTLTINLYRHGYIRFRRPGLIGYGRKSPQPLPDDELRIVMRDAEKEHKMAA